MRTLERIDKNGTKYWIESDCPRCGGSGYLGCYTHIEGGVCFKCNGSGKYPHRIIERTPEYEEKLRLRRLEKARKEAPERNAKFFKSIGCTEDGITWLVLGDDTYSIKEDLKAAGAKYNDLLGWHFDHAVEEFSVAEFDVKTLADELDDGTLHVEMYNIHLIRTVKEFRKQRTVRPESPSQYIGEIGERLTTEVELKNEYCYETYFTYSGELNAIYTFEDSCGNVFVWKTSPKGLEIGHSYKVVGTVKDHNEYKGVKQTVLTRCKVA